MTPEEDIVHLNNIAQCIMEIEGYTENMEYEDFVTDEEGKAAVMRNLTMIGNAADQLSDEFKNQYDDIDIRVLESLKHAMYNDEMEMFHTPTWHIIKKDLPYIRKQVFDAQMRVGEETDIKGTTKRTGI